LFVGSSESDLVSELRPTIFVCFIRLSFMWFLKEALGEGRRAESFFAVLLLAVAAGSCRAEAVEAPPIRRFGEIVCDAMDLFGICIGISCPDGHVRSVCTATELDFIGAAAVTVGCRWAETAADTTAAEVGPLRRTVLCCWMTIYDVLAMTFSIHVYIYIRPAHPPPTAEPIRG